MAFPCWPSLLAGALLLLVVEAALAVVLLLRLLRGLRTASHGSYADAVSSAHQAALDRREAGNAALPPSPRAASQRGALLLQGVVWIATEPRDSGRKTREKQKRRDSFRDAPDLNPVWRRVKLQERTLVLTAPDGTEECICLEGCDVVAVSAASVPGRKWAKRFPVKIYHDKRVLYNGLTTCFLYFNTGWEKEAWCEVLRGAAKLNYDAEDDWYVKLKREFEEYSLKVSNQLPFSAESSTLRKPSIGVVEAESGSKKRRFTWRRLARRSSKNSRDFKATDGREQSSVAASRPLVDAEDKFSARGIADGSSRTAASERRLSNGEAIAVADEGSRLGGVASTRPDTVDVITASVAQKTGDDTQNNWESRNMDHGLLCWNIIISRFFFDIYHSTHVTSLVQQRIQKLLTAKTQNPGYIAALTCTHLDLGTSPPLAHAMRVLPVDSEGVWSLEADVEYYGGAILTVETRLDLRDPKDQEKVANQGLEASLAGAATADLLTKGFGTLGEDLEIAGNAGLDASALPEKKGAGASKSVRKGWVQSSLASCKAMLMNVAEQVSQVPLALSVKVVSLKGTLRICFRPPPSDRIWFCFTSMPLLEMESEPCIGERKINSAPVGAYIVERIKILLKEALVLPQCEDIHLPWMITDVGNWVPQSAAPLPWSGPVQNGEGSSSDAPAETSSTPNKEKYFEGHTSTACGDGPQAKQPSLAKDLLPEGPKSDHAAPILPITTVGTSGPYASEFLVPLLGGNEVEIINGNQDHYEPVDIPTADTDVSSRSLGGDDVESRINKPDSHSLGGDDVESSINKPDSHSLGGDDVESRLTKPSGSRRAKVLNLGKKLNDKRRHVIERIRERKSGGGVPEVTEEELAEGRVA